MEVLCSDLIASVKGAVWDDYVSHGTGKTDLEMIDKGKTPGGLLSALNVTFVALSLVVGCPP